MLDRENAESREEYEDFDYDDVSDEDVVDDDDEGGEDEIDDEAEDEEYAEESEEGEDEGDVEPEAEEDAAGGKVKFTAEQQKIVDQIVQKRLERKDAQFVKQVSEIAGVQLEATEIPQSARLWGLLKANPELSDAVDLVINSHLRNGKAKEIANSDLNRESKLELKEAVLDMKLEDPLFRKNADKIIEWAEDKGYPVNSKKSLQLAVLAWKGSKDAILSKAKQSSEQKKQFVKQTTQKRAGVQGGASAKANTPSDFRKMSDRDVLTRNGLSLFTDE